MVDLVTWSLDDKEALMKIGNAVDRSYLSDRLPCPYTEANAEWYINMAIEKDGKEGIWRAIRADSQIVGTISLEQKGDVFCKDAEIGCMIAPWENSKGVATEATMQFCRLAFETMDIVRITSNVYATNLASRRVMEKCGFVLEGIMKNAVYKNGELVDLCIYGKYSAE